MINNLGNVFLIFATCSLLTIVAAELTYNRFSVFSNYYRFLDTGKWELSDDDFNNPFEKVSSFLSFLSVPESGDVPCGVPAIQPKSNFVHATIVNGTPAVPGSWPYVVSLRWNNTHLCGGTVLNKQWILTAAHCFDSKNLSNWEVHLGRYHKDGDEKWNVLVRKIGELFINPYYKTTTFDSDIALLKLSKSIKYTDYIRPICLPTMEPTTGVPCTVVGWGETKGTGSSSLLNQVAVPIINMGTCNDIKHYKGHITNNMTCAGYDQGGKDACQRDSGGPLMNKVNGAWQLTGVVSWGHGCAKRQKPGVYTNVYKYIKWIKDTMKNN